MFDFDKNIQNLTKQITKLDKQLKALKKDVKPVKIISDGSGKALQNLNKATNERIKGVKKITSIEM